MRRRHACSLVIAAAILTPRPAAAQADLSSIYPGPRRVDISASGGYVLSTDWSDLVLVGSVSPATGALQQVLVRDLVVRPGPVFDATVTYWEGRYGFRSHVGFAESCLTTNTSCVNLPGFTAARSSVDVNTWTYDVGGSIGLIDYRRNAWAWPYVFFGFGGVTYDLEQTVVPPLAFIEQSPPPSRNDSVVVSADRTGPLVIQIDELNIETKFAVNFGAGADLRVPVGGGTIGVRLEVSDHIHPSPIDILLVDAAHAGFVHANADVDFGYVHNLRASAGLVLQFGR